MDRNTIRKILEMDDTMNYLTQEERDDICNIDVD